MRKIFALDIDGTLLSERDKTVSKKVLKAVKILQQKGHIVGIATGRNLEQMKKVLNPSDFDFLVLINGGYVKYKDQVIQKNLFSKTEVENLINYCDNLNWSYGVSDLNFVHAMNIDEKIIAVHDNFDIPLPKLIENFDSLDVYQFMVYEDFDKLEIVEKEKPQYEYYRYRISGFDISLAHIAKDTGLKRVVKHLNADMKDVIAFGDADNDLTMMAAVGLGIAMGNGSDHLKEVADYVTDDVDEDGIVKALIHFGYIKMEELV